VAAARGEDAPPLFLHSQKCSSAIPEYLGVYFAIFELYIMCLDLFRFYVICNYIWVYEKNIIKRGCVCVCSFLCMLLNYKIKKTKKMNLLF